MVLVDARHESVDEHLTVEQVAAEDAQQQRFQTMIKWMARFGLVRLLWAPAWPRVLPGTENLAPETRTAIGVLQARPRQIETALAERSRAPEQQHSAWSGQRRLGTYHSIVLASAQSIEHLPFWKDAQQITTGLSSNSRLIVASEQATLFTSSSRDWWWRASTR